MTPFLEESRQHQPTGLVVGSIFDQYERLTAAGLFDADFYIASNPDIQTLNTDPLLHYLEVGASEGRQPHPHFDVDFYLSQVTESEDARSNPLLHFLDIGATKGLKTHPHLSSLQLQAEPSEEANAHTTFTLQVDRATLDFDPEHGNQLHVVGWIVGSDVPTSLLVSVGDIEVGAATLGVPRPDVARVHAGKHNCERAGFVLKTRSLPIGVEHAGQICIDVHFANGTSYQQLAPLHVHAVRASGHVPGVAGAPVPHSPMELYIDDVRVDHRGLLEASGWAVCFVEIEHVDAFIDTEHVGACEYGRLREDVEHSRPDFPNSRFSGFFIKLDVARFGFGPHSLRLRAVSRSGATRQAVVPISVPQIDPSRPLKERTVHFHCDAVELYSNGTIKVAGWAFGPAPTHDIKVLLDGNALGAARTGLTRPDVGNAYPLLPHARASGFTFQETLARDLSGEHLITLEIRDSAGNERVVPIPVETQPADESDAMGGTALDDATRNSGGEPDNILNIDLPRLVNSAADAPIRGRFTVAGWGIAKSGATGVEIFLDGKRVATARYGIRRPDVASVFPGRADALASGFEAGIPERALTVGSHVVRVALIGPSGPLSNTEFHIEVDEIPDGTGPQFIRRKMGRAEIDLWLATLRNHAWHPEFCLLIPFPMSEEAVIRTRRTMESLTRQAYPNWHVVLFSPTYPIKSQKAVQASLLEGLEGLEKRTQLLWRRGRALLADLAATPAGSKPWFLMLDGGDELGCDALLEIAVTSALHRTSDFVYFDERRTSAASDEMEAFFKPQWSPDLLLSTNYLGRAWSCSEELLRRSRLSLSDVRDHGQYETVLRLTESANRIQHVPHVLIESSSSAHTPTLEKAALERALKRRHIEGAVEPGIVPNSYRVRRKLASEGLVSIIIPTCAARGLIKTCLDTLRQRTAYRNFEIICIENISDANSHWRDWLRANADKVISTQEPFNWSRFNNLAAQKASGEFLLFLNDDIEVLGPDWLEAMLELAQRHDVAAVGPLLLYPDRSVQHAGLVLNEIGRVRHQFRHAGEHDAGYFGLQQTMRNVVGVTGACLLTRRSTFDELKGFDEAHTVVANDLDYCLRGWRSGRVNVYTPHAKLIHHELVSRSELRDEYDSAGFEKQWRKLFLMGDPYFSPNLSRQHDDFQPEYEPPRLVYAGHPLLAIEGVRSILVMKLDHIGDCITGLPAVRRLRKRFEHARIVVLSAKATQSVWTKDVGVDEVLEFNFFHARSGQGQVGVTESQLAALQERLRPYRFDLAIDLRKALDTRRLLQWTGAQFLAGFDYQSQFPWLDISVEWEGDPVQSAKRSHVADDLLRLVESVSLSCESDRHVLSKPKGRLAALSKSDRRRFATTRVVCVHPAVGNQARQWPSSHFSSLIDLLVEDGVTSVALIGGPDEKDVADSVLGRVTSKEAVMNFVGRLKLAELPLLMSRCALFVGNNSGPKHIAAGLGIPTVGIHSGVVDAREWGPLGPTAVAIQRDMSCHPCYVEKASDCHRSLACLTGLGPGSVYKVCQRLLANGYHR